MAYMVYNKRRISSDFYSSAALTWLEDALLVSNPNAPNYEPALWNDGTKQNGRGIENYYPDIVRKLLETGSKATSYKMAVDILYRKTSEVSRILGLKPERIEQFKKTLKDLFFSVTYSTNCYDYAANHRRIQPGLMGIPGAKSDQDCDLMPNTLSVLIKKIQHDGFILHPPEAKDIPDNHYWALLLCSDRNFHFVRQDQTGFSHKPGHHHASNLDFSDERIQSPLRADWGEHTRLEAAFCIPAGGLATAVQPDLDPELLAQAQVL